MKQLLIAASLLSAVAFQAEAAKLIPANSAPAATVQPTAAPATNNSSVTVASPPATITPLAQVQVPRVAPPPAPRAAAQTPSIDTGFYLGAQLGESSLGPVFGYQFTKMFGMEISYDYFDTIYERAINETITEKNRLGASGLAMFPMKFSEMGPMALFVKVGYARTVDTLTENIPAFGSVPASSNVTTTTRTSVTGGGGIHVDMSESASVRLGVNVLGDERVTYLNILYRF